MIQSATTKTFFFQTLLATMSLLACYPPLQAQTGQRFKRIDYTYDLISGKVNDVLYQAGKPDAFYHKHEYDADNRITRVYTSKDSVLWDNDARYQYYAHGPLARVELGDNNVQGMDYTYTLQGWIKGVNSNLLKSENDIGNDGLAGSANSRVANDAFGYTLNYHAGDYTPIDASKWSTPAQRFEAVTPGSDLMAARFDLFNGNIGSMVTTIVEPKVYTGAANEMPNILPQGTAYRYDQLNRLLEMKAFQNLDVITNIWKQGSVYAGLYHNVFKYDANGNILYQERADQHGAAFDKMTYQYKTGADGRRLQNRLYHVNDGNTNTTLATDDIEDQGTFTPSPSSPISINDVNNYRYDEIGNLKYDSLEGIDKIEWTVYGKIKSITRLQGNLRSDLEFLYDASGNRVAKIEKPRDANGVKPQNDWIGTYYARDAQGNVMGIYKLTTATAVPSFKVIERNLFGSSRLGSDYTELELAGASASISPFIRTLGNKHFEGSNHLGNVLTVFSDRKISRDDNGNGGTDYFQVDVLSANDYSPFGVVLDGRSFGTSGRYGFNGKEEDDEVKEKSNHQDYGMRAYDVRLGRFFSVDPIAKEYPELSTYQFASNRPIDGIDLDGLEHVTFTIVIRFGYVVSITTDYDLKLKNKNTRGTGKLYKRIYIDMNGTVIGEKNKFIRKHLFDFGNHGDIITLNSQK
ncbi:MAG: RHS repeat-associated core domain-containing protein [Saprospiraceae bacterium]|nr:RHS repeat-associated core domain-containing protein [Saprospiraceae bacterium]